jgi:hypothetical protein
MKMVPMFFRVLLSSGREILGDIRLAHNENFHD